jgi:RNA polymerase sigma-70 factor (ECF subfamily)
VALSDFDRRLLQRCLAREPKSWEDFVDRFLGLVVHVVNHTAASRSLNLAEQDREDLTSEVFLSICQADFRVLRAFRGESSLATYLTALSRRVIVRHLQRRRAVPPPSDRVQSALSLDLNPEQRIADAEEVERLLAGLHGSEAEVVRLYHLEGKTYREISDRVGMPENSIGPTLSRARSKMRMRARS